MKKVISLFIVFLLVSALFVIPASADEAAPLRLDFEVHGNKLCMYVVNTSALTLNTLKMYSPVRDESVFGAPTVSSDFFTISTGENIFCQLSDDHDFPAETQLLCFEFDILTPLVEGTEYNFSIQLLSAKYNVFNGPIPTPTEYSWHDKQVTGKYELPAAATAQPLELVAEEDNGTLHVKLVATESFRFSTITFDEITFDSSVFTYQGYTVPNSRLVYNSVSGGSDFINTNDNPFYLDQGDVLVSFNYTIGTPAPNEIYTFEQLIVKLAYLDSSSNSHNYPACANLTLRTTYSENILQPEYDATPITVEQRDQIAGDSRGALRFKITVNLNGAKLVDGTATYNDNGAWTIGNRYAIIYSEQSGKTTTIPCPLIYSADANQLVYTIVITNIDAAKAGWKFLTNAKVEFTHGDVTETIETNVTDLYSFNSASGQN